MRIALVHPSIHSIEPVRAAFRSDWPEADVVNLLDDSLYHDVGTDGAMPADIGDRVASLFKHCILSGARGIVFTGSTFGKVVDAQRQAAEIPILKPDEAMAASVSRQGGNVVLLCTARRAIPIITDNLNAASAHAGRSLDLTSVVVEGAAEALASGDRQTHDALIADAANAHQHADIIVLGQISMAPALGLMSEAVRARAVASPHSTVSRMRSLLETPASALAERTP